MQERTKKLAVPKNNTVVKKRSSTKTIVTKPSTPKIKKQERTKNILWVGSAQKVSPGCSSRSKKEFFDE